MSRQLQLYSINYVWTMDLRSRISLVRIGHHDSITWDDNSRVTISTIYHKICDRGVGPPEIKAICPPLHIPKCSFLSWLSFRDRLITRDCMLSYEFWYVG